MQTCQVFSHVPEPWEGRFATALLLAECERWPPSMNELPQVYQIQDKVENLWMHNENWPYEFVAILSLSCLKNPERLAPLQRYLRGQRP